MICGLFLLGHKNVKKRHKKIVIRVFSPVLIFYGLEEILKNLLYFFKNI